MVFLKYKVLTFSCKENRQIILHRKKLGSTHALRGAAYLRCGCLAVPLYLLSSAPRFI